MDMDNDKECMVFYKFDYICCECSDFYMFWNMVGMVCCNFFYSCENKIIYVCIFFCSFCEFDLFDIYYND